MMFRFLWSFSCLVFFVTGYEVVKVSIHNDFSVDVVADGVEIESVRYNLEDFEAPPNGCRAKLGRPRNHGGWFTLRVEDVDEGVKLTDGSENRTFYCFGFAEGFLLANEMTSFYLNSYADWFTDFKGSPNPAPVLKFLDDNLVYMREMVAKHKDSDDYWREVSFILNQMDGMYEGYLLSCQRQGIEPVFTLTGLMVISANGDLQTLASMYTPKPAMLRTNDERLDFTAQKESKCSALFKPIKLENGEEDVLVGHTTWDHYENVFPRVLKTFIFNAMPSHSFTMSSSPGMIASVDDFYITSSGLVVTETTNDLYNSTIFNTVTPNSVLSWVRTRIANLEKTPKDWADTFTKYNSGTYNNQWLIISAEMYFGKQKKESFVVLEQLPEFIIWDFKTNFLEEEGYWASYNLPYFDDVFERAGYKGKLPEDEFAYRHSPRAKIFKRQIDQGDAETLEGFKKLIRFNQADKDPLSKGNFCFSISSRCDLNPVKSPVYKASGGIDAKVVSLRSVLQGFESVEFHAQLGPSYDDRPPFSWNSLSNRLEANGIPTPSHIGQVESFNFPWITYQVFESAAADGDGHDEWFQVVEQ